MDNIEFTPLEVAVLQLALQDQIKLIDESLEFNEQEDVLNEHCLNRAKILRDASSSVLFKTILAYGELTPPLHISPEQMKRYLK